MRQAVAGHLGVSAHNSTDRVRGSTPMKDCAEILLPNESRGSGCYKGVLVRDLCVRQNPTSLSLPMA